MKDVHLARFAHSCKNFLQAHEKSQKLPGWRTFAFIAIFRCSLSHLQNLRELREITGWAIFHDTWHFRFFFVTLKTNSKSSCGFYQIYAAEIAKNHQSYDFSQYLRYLLFFFMLMIIKSKASCRSFFVVRCIASDLEYSIFPTDSAMEILTIALIGLFGLC